MVGYVINQEVAQFLKDPTAMSVATNEEKPDNYCFVELDANMMLEFDFIETAKQKFYAIIMNFPTIESHDLIQTEEAFSITINRFNLSIEKNNTDVTYITSEDICKYLVNFLRNTDIAMQAIKIVCRDKMLAITAKEEKNYHAILNKLTQLGIIDNDVSECIQKKEAINISFHTPEELLAVLLKNTKKHLSFLKKIVSACCKDLMQDKHLQARLMSMLQGCAELKKTFFGLDFYEDEQGYFEFQDYLKLFNGTESNYSTIMLFKNYFNYRYMGYLEDTPEEFICKLLKDIKTNGNILKSIVTDCIYNTFTEDKILQNKILQAIKANENFMAYVSKDTKFLALIILYTDSSPLVERVKKVLELGELSNHGVIINYLRSLPAEEVSAFIRSMAFYPAVTKTLLPDFNRLVYLEIYDDGKSVDTWSMLAEVVLRKTDLNGFSKNRHPVVSDFIANWEKNVLIEDFNLKTGILDKGWKFLRIQGRTILFKRPEDEKLLAIKIQKKQENINELHKQNNTVKFFREQAVTLGIKNPEAEPMGVKKITGLKQFIDDLCHKKLISEKEAAELFNNIHKTDASHAAYAYQAPPAYFTYLHDPQLTSKEFYEAAARAFDTFLALLDQGIVYDQLADLFHDQEADASKRDDRGRYLTLVNLMRRIVSGGGELEAWEKAVEFLNIRKEVGIVDEGDWHLIEMFTDAAAELAKKFFSEAHSKHGEKVSIYLAANFMAEFFLIIELAAGKRVVNELKQNPQLKQEEIDTLWKNMVTQLHKIYVHGFATFTKLPMDVVQRLFDEALDVDAYTKEMQCWMSKNYINDIKNDRLPSGLYPHTRVYLNFDRIRKKAFNDKSGFDISNTGESQDIGTVSSQYLIKTGESARYQFATFGFISRNAVNESEKKWKQGNDYEEEGNYLEAQKCYRKAVDLNPFATSPRRSLYLASKKIAEAMPTAETQQQAEMDQKEFGVTSLQRIFRERKQAKR